VAESDRNVAILTVIFVCRSDGSFVLSQSANTPSL